MRRERATGRGEAFSHQVLRPVCPRAKANGHAVDRILTAVTAGFLRAQAFRKALLASLVVLGALLVPGSAHSANDPPRVLAGQVRQRHQPGHGRLPDRRDRPREQAALRRGRDRARHARRPRRLDEQGRQEGTRLEGAGDRLHRSRGRRRRLGRRVDLRGRRRARDGAADDDRCVDADQRQRQPSVRLAAKGDQLLREQGALAGGDSRPERHLGRLGRAKGLEPHLERSRAPEHRRPPGRVCPGVAREDRRPQDEAEGHRPAHEGRRGDHREDGLLEAPARHADRPQSDRADALARRARDRDRALAPGPDLPGDLRRALSRDRLLRPRRAADQLGRRRPARGRVRLLDHRAVHRLQPRRLDGRRSGLLRLRLPAALRAGRIVLPGLALGSARGGGDVLAVLRVRARKGRPDAAPAGERRHAHDPRPARAGSPATATSPCTASSGRRAPRAASRSSRAKRWTSSPSTGFRWSSAQPGNPSESRIQS